MYYYYDGQKIIETRDGLDNVVRQFIHGTQYIDELVMVRLVDEDDLIDLKGDLYVHQDANWNVIALTDLGGNVVERYVYTPYGQVTVHQETSYGDYDGDGDVDVWDRPAIPFLPDGCAASLTGACCILDLDFDGDYDSTDRTLHEQLPQGLARHPGRVATGVDQPFAHQGLLFEPEIGSYQVRHRQLDPAKRRWLQQDPFAFLPASFIPNLHYIDGLNLYAYVNGNPVTLVDPRGTGQPKLEAPCSDIGHQTTCGEGDSCGCCYYGQKSRTCPCTCTTATPLPSYQLTPGSTCGPWGSCSIGPCGSEHIVFTFVLVAFGGVLYLKRRRLPAY